MNRLQCEVWLRTVFKREVIRFANELRHFELDSNVKGGEKELDQVFNNSTKRLQEAGCFSDVLSLCEGLVDEFGGVVHNTAQGLVVLALSLALIEHAEDDLLVDWASEYGMLDTDDDP